MNRPIPRADLERFSASLAEKRRRIAKADHQTRGYRDEDGVWQGGLLSFVRYFWHVLEPGTPFVDGWVPEAICEHLEAVTYGDITNLIINVFPGATKSLFTNVFWPAWEWGPMDLSHLRYVTFSYSSSNTERDNQRFGDLISSPEYHAMYPDVAIRQRGMTMVSNHKHGWKWASSVSGSATGKRGNRAICFPWEQLVQTEFGPLPIGEIVDGRFKMRVPSMNTRTGEVSLQPIAGWHRNPGSEIVKITLSDGSSVRCTPSHRIWDGMQWVEASCLRIGSVLPVVTSADVVSDLSPGSAYTNALNSHAFYAVTRRQYGCCFSSVHSDLPNLIFGKNRKSARRQKGSVLERIVNVLLPRSILKIGSFALQGFTVFVADLLSFWARTQERIGNYLVKHPHVGFPILSHAESQISLSNSTLHDLAGVGHVMPTLLMSDPIGIDRNSTFTVDGARHAANSGKVGNFVNSLKPDDRTPFLIVESVDFDGQVDCSYCLTVEHNHTFVAGLRRGLIVSNCDDLNNVKESESKTVMDETNRWFRESLSSRLNNMETDAKVVIAQRVGEGDVSGEILRLGLPYCHLCIPMEFVWQADENGDAYTTQIGWVDPRWRPDKDDCEGELAWPERFSEKSVQSLKVELGPFATASQLQQTPEARGGGLIKREWWMPGEVYMTNDGQKFPPFEYLVASLDGAYTEDEKNDPSALVVLGVFTNEHGYNRAMLVHAWDKRLEFSGPKVEVQPNEHESMYRRRAMPHWGLIEWVADTCKRFKVDKLLIESKASGISAAQSLRNSHGREGWVIQLVEPKGDKYARGLAVQSSFSQEMIYAPDREWATKVIDNCAIFPYGAQDDLYDAMMQAVKHLRDTGLIRSDEERRAQEMEAVRHRGAPKPGLYPGMRARSA